MFGAMQVAKRIPFDDKPEYIMYARAAYVAAQVICLLINYYCAFRVRKVDQAPLFSAPRLTLHVRFALIRSKRQMTLLCSSTSSQRAPCHKNLESLSPRPIAITI